MITADIISYLPALYVVSAVMGFVLRMNVFALRWLLARTP